MRSASPLHRVTIGRTRGVRGPDGLEWGFVGLIVTAVAMVGLWFGVQFLHVVQVLDAVSLVSGTRNNLVVYRALHGTWPSPSQADVILNARRGLHVADVVLGEDGVITAEVVLGPGPPWSGTAYAPDADAIDGILSFRPELLGSPLAPSVVFHCGYADSIGQSATSAATNPSTLDPRRLPHFCR